MTEQKLWTALRALLPMVHWQRIEVITGAGIPDGNGCYAGVEFWVELKVITGKEKLSFQSEFKPTQFAWMRNRVAAGGRCFVLGARNDELWIWTGIEDLKRLCLEGPGVIEPCHKISRPYDRGNLLFILSGRG